MRHIQLAEGLRLRFPGRPEEFDQGVEIGIVAGLMAGSAGAFTHRIGVATLEQVQNLAERFGYHLVCDEADGDCIDVTFRRGRPRAKLTLVHSGESPRATPDRARLAKVGGRAEPSLEPVRAAQS